MRAAGGTRVPLMFDWLMWLSIPNVNAEWEKPAVRGKPGLCGRAEGCARPRGPGAAPRAGPPAPGLGGAGQSEVGTQGRPRRRGRKRSFPRRAVSALLNTAP